MPSVPRGAQYKYGNSLIESLRRHRDCFLQPQPAVIEIHWEAQKQHLLWRPKDLFSAYYKDNSENLFSGPVVALVHCLVPQSVEMDTQPLDQASAQLAFSHQLCTCSVPYSRVQSKNKLIKCTSWRLQQSFLSVTSAGGKSHIQGLLLSYHIALQSFMATHVFLCALLQRVRFRCHLIAVSNF